MHDNGPEAAMAGLALDADHAGFSLVTVGVADMAAALAFWRDDIGMEAVFVRDGDDPGLARLWQIEPDAIAGQALLRTPGCKVGMLHLVAFRNPAAPVREDAQAFDRVPKNLDIMVRDLPGLYARLKANGHAFRGAGPSDVTAPDGTRFREIHLHAADAVNVVLVEVLGANDAVRAWSAQGTSGIGPLVLIVDDAPGEAQFFARGFGMDRCKHNVIAGPEIERAVGLPPGTALDITIVGREGVEQPAGYEIIAYRGVAGDDLYARARPPARGILSVSYLVSDGAALRDRLVEAGAAIVDHGPIACALGSGAAFSLTSPAGLSIHVLATGGGEQP